MNDDTQDAKDMKLGRALREAVEAMPDGKTITIGKNFQLLDFRADDEYVKKLQALSFALPAYPFPNLWSEPTIQATASTIAPFSLRAPLPG